MLAKNVIVTNGVGRVIQRGELLSLTNGTGLVQFTVEELDGIIALLQAAQQEINLNARPRTLKFCTSVQIGT